MGEFHLMEQFKMFAPPGDFWTEINKIATYNNLLTENIEKIVKK